MTRNFKERLADIKAFAFDVDGVLTDGTLYLHPSGELLRTSNVRDGYAMRRAIDMGYPVAIITGGVSESLSQRFANLGLTDLYFGCADKCVALAEFCQRNGITPAQVLYMGDDLPDAQIMQRVGIATCPQDADYEIKQLSAYISNFDGGRGCARDVIEQVLRLNGHWGCTADGRMQ